jgi:isopentenyl phosphate kinase
MKKHIIKLGGSIITDTSSKAYFNKKNTLRLAKELYPFYKGCILIHGTGQVGKPPAIKYGYVDNGILPQNEHLIALNIKNSLRQLNQHVVHTFLSASIPVIPFDILHFYDESKNHLNYKGLKDILLQMLKNGLVPVFYGDLLPLPDGSFKVFSSDLITLLLAKTLKPENVIFLSDVNGVYLEHTKSNNEASSNIIPVLNPKNIRLLIKSENDKKDVSGGMRKKAELALEISRYCKRCFIGNGLTDNILSNFFKEKSVVGTFVRSKNI